MPAMGICEWIAAGRAIAEGQLTRYGTKAHFTDEVEQELCQLTGAKHVLTSDDQFYARARSYHDLGAMIRGHEDRYNEPDFVGTNMKVTEIQSAMLQVQLHRVQPMLEQMQKRRALMASILNHSDDFVVTPHNDNAISLTILAPTRETAIELQQQRGIWNRLHDCSRHIYTNWESILAKRTFHPKMNPWKWAKGEINYSPDICTRTLDILERTCVVNIGLKYPSFMMQKVAERIAA